MSEGLSIEVTGVALCLVALAAGRPTCDVRSAYPALERAKQPEERVGDLDLAAARILARLARPLELDREVELTRLQDRYLDPADPNESAFLEEVRSSNDHETFFVVEAEARSDGLLVKRGVRLNAATRRQRVLFERTGSSKELGVTDGLYHVLPTAYHAGRITGRGTPGGTISALRMNASPYVTLGRFLSSTLPPVASEIAPVPGRPDLAYRADVAIDQIVGRDSEGDPILSRIEYSIDTLLQMLYFQFPYEGDVVLWVGDEAAGFEVERAPSDAKPRRTTGVVRASLSTLVKGRLGRPVSYNPLELRLGEVQALLDLLDGRVECDRVCVDRRRDAAAPPLRLVSVDGRIALLLSVALWRNLAVGEEGAPLIDVPRAAEHLVPEEADEELRAAMQEWTTVALPPGTVLVTDSDGARRHGVWIECPGGLAFAELANASVTWYVYDQPSVDRAVRDYAFPLPERIRWTYSDGRGAYYGVTLDPGRGVAPPVILLEPEGVVRLRVASRWENAEMKRHVERWNDAVAEMKRRGAYGMSYDEASDSFTFLEEGVPLTRNVQVQRPVFRDCPGLIEE